MVETKSPVAPLSMRMSVGMLFRCVVREMGGWRGWPGGVVLWMDDDDDEVSGVSGEIVPADTRSSTGPCLLPAMEAWLERLGSWKHGVQGDGT